MLRKYKRGAARARALCEMNGNVQRAIMEIDLRVGCPNAACRVSGHPEEAGYK